MITLYFYRWNLKYYECAQMADAIIVPYEELLGPNEVLQSQEQNRKRDQDQALPVRNLENLRALKQLQCQGVKIFGVLPVISGGCHDAQIQRWRQHEPKAAWEFDEPGGPVDESICPDGIYMGNQGQLALMENFTGPKFGDAGFNVFNSAAADFWSSCGLNGVTLSYELEPVETLELLKAVYRKNNWRRGEAHPLEILLYGRVPVMVSEYCPIAGAAGSEGDHCGKCADVEAIYLKARKGEQYPVILDRKSCRSLILSADRIHRQAALMGLLSQLDAEFLSRLSYRVCVFDEPPQSLLEIMKKMAGPHQINR